MVCTSLLDERPPDTKRDAAQISTLADTWITQLPRAGAVSVTAECPSSSRAAPRTLTRASGSSAQGRDLGGPYTAGGDAVMAAARGTESSRRTSGGPRVATQWKRVRPMPRGGSRSGEISGV